ncbi:YbjQ family protein [Nocardia sp. NPDC058640]|uniref:YbjQ family protein n=1 Tax=Nocardia sp. NPDC058640 TaxID=3346571 RepID=UPI003655A7AE
MNQPPLTQSMPPHGTPPPTGQQFPILVSTMNDVPGHEVVRVFGEVAGLTVRTLGIGNSFSAGFRSISGGEVPEYTKLLYQARYEAIMRMCQHGMAFGANAIIAMRFDCNGIAGSLSEVAAYGTAVAIRPVQQAPVDQPV